MAATITSAPFRLTKSSVFNEASNAKTRFQIRRRKKWTNIGCFAWMCVFVQILWTFHWMWNLLIYLLNVSRFNQNMHAKDFHWSSIDFLRLRYNVSLFLMTTLIYTHTHARARSVDACPSLGPSIYRQTDRHWAMESKQVNYFCCMIALVIADAVDGKYCHRLFHHVCAFFVSIFEGSIRVYVRILLYLFCNCNAVQSTGFNQNEQKSWRNREKSKASDGEIESVTQAIYWLCGKNNIGRIKNTFVGFETNSSTKISFGHW